MTDQALTFVAAVLAFGLMLVLYAALRERLDALPVPAALKGTPIALVTAGLLALAVAGVIGVPATLPIWLGLAVLVLMAGALAAGLARASRRVRLKGDALVARIDAVLPQTQCGQCGYPGCRPYARAIAEGTADINQCPPGGEAGVRALAQLLGREPRPLSAEHGVEKPPQVARIREDECIGCVKCIAACPVDAIIGAPKRLHVVIEDLCTGCELCIAPCPVDCIDLVPAEPLAQSRWTR